MIRLYTLIFYLFLPFIFLRLLWRSRHGASSLDRFSERLGYYKEKNNVQNSIWVHAVSLGEAKLACNLVTRLQKDLPEIQFVVTTMTLTGSQIIRQELSEKVTHVYVPYDIPQIIKRFIKQFNPKLLILLETELWPNIMNEMGEKNIPIILANARLSSKSLNGYRKLNFFIKKFLPYLTLILAQTKQDAERFAMLGIQKEKIQVVGNLKYDMTIADAMQLQTSQPLISERPIFIAASTHAGEEEIILNAFFNIKRQIPNVLLILVPRHPERFDIVEKLCKELNFSTERFSQNVNKPTADIFILDTIGQLLNFYAIAEVVFVGGSLVAKGGHNLLEPAVLGKPVLSGPHLNNFHEIAEELKTNNALIIVNNAEELAKTVIELLMNENLREEKGQLAKRVASRSQKALERTGHEVRRFL